MTPLGPQMAGILGAAGTTADSTVLENVAVVANTATLEAITNESEGFIAYNAQTFALWVSSTGTDASVTFYAKQDS